MNTPESQEPFSLDALLEKRHYVPSEQGKQDYVVALITSYRNPHHRSLVVSMSGKVRNGTELGVLHIPLVVDEQELVAGLDTTVHPILVFSHSPDNPISYYSVHYDSVNPTDHNARIVSIAKMLSGWQRDEAKLGEHGFEEMVARVVAETGLPVQMDWWETARMYATGMVTEAGGLLPLTAEHIFESPVVAAA